MSFLQRGLNVIKGKVSLLQERDAAAERQKIKDLEKELEQTPSLSTVPEKQSDGAPEVAPDPQDSSSKPLSPRERTI